MWVDGEPVAPPRRAVERERPALGRARPVRPRPGLRGRRARRLARCGPPHEEELSRGGEARPAGAERRHAAPPADRLRARVADVDDHRPVVRNRRCGGCRSLPRMPVDVPQDEHGTAIGMRPTPRRLRRRDRTRRDGAAPTSAPSSRRIPVRSWDERPAATEVVPVELDDEHRPVAPETAPVARSARRAAASPMSRERRHRPRPRAGACDAATRAAASASRSSPSRRSEPPPTIASRTRAHVRLVDVVAEAERVGPGGEREHGGLLHPVAVPLIAPISSASVTTMPVNPSSSRSRPVSTARLSVAGSASSAGTTMWAVITDSAPAAKAATNGTSSTARSSSRARLDDREAEVRVDLGRRRGRGSASRRPRRRPPAGPSTNAATWRATRAGSLPNERTPIDRVQRVRVDVGDRGEVVGDRRPRAARRRRRARRPRSAPGRRPRRARARPARSSRAPPRAGSRRRPPRRSRRRVSGETRIDAVSARSCSGSRTLRAKRTTPPRPGVELAQEPVGRRLAGEPGQDAGPREPLERGAHPLTEPAVRPKAMRRCTSRKKTTTGIAVSVEAAISAPQSVLRLVP